MTNKIPDAQQVINAFRESNCRWIVAVGMISEGTDIPRLQVCCYLSRIRTELHYRQVLGRILRRIGKSDDEAWLFMLAEPTLQHLAGRIADDLPEDLAVLKQVQNINPLVRPGVPITAAEILNRINEISFNSSLMREMRTIAFVTDLIQQGKVGRDEMKEILIHSIRSDKAMCELSVSSKYNTDWAFLCGLRDNGRREAEAWLTENYRNIGERSSIHVRKEFL